MIIQFIDILFQVILIASVGLIGAFIIWGVTKRYIHNADAAKAVQNSKPAAGSTYRESLRVCLDIDKLQRQLDIKE